MKLHPINQLLALELQDLYSVEHQLLAALPKLTNKATDPNLKKTYQSRLAETESRIDRLHQIRDLLNIDLEGEICARVKGLIHDGEKLFTEDSGELLDQLLIAASKRIVKYEHAAYGCAITFARLSKCKPAEKLLKETAASIARTDKRLTKMALAELRN